MDIDSLRYPVGTFNIPGDVSDEQFEVWVGELEAFPSTIRGLTEQLSADQLALTYRPEGWMIKQVVHHCADSHINSFVRFKRAITEDEPTVQVYDEAAWAEHADDLDDQLTHSYQILEGVHARWVKFLRSLTEAELSRTLHHPDYKQPWTVKAYVGNYAWHCRHHLAHIRLALQSADKV